MDAAYRIEGHKNLACSAEAELRSDATSRKGASKPGMTPSRILAKIKKAIGKEPLDYLPLPDKPEKQTGVPQKTAQLLQCKVLPANELISALQHFRIPVWLWPRGARTAI